MWIFRASRYYTQLNSVVSMVSVVYVLYSLRWIKVNWYATTMMIDKPQNTLQKLQSDQTTYDSKLKYNLMEETHGIKWKTLPKKYYDPQNCTLEYANAQKLQQDHPCVVRIIRDSFLRQPSSRSIPYELNIPELTDPSDGQSKGILRILRNYTNGFFIECGAFDGEFLSNTLYMERSLNWTGLLIEADQNAFRQLSTRNRKAYTASVCLSTKPYPMEVLYDTTNALFSSIVVKNNEKPETEGSSQNEESLLVNVTANVHKKQCFPFYSILLAIGRTKIDYFSLDVEGSEYKILKTIPWMKVDIKTLTVEWNHTPEGEVAITHLMEMNKFVKFGYINMGFSHEVVYIQDFLYDLRLYE